MRRALLATAAALACCAPAAAAAPGDISTVAGTTPGSAGDGGPAMAAQLSHPTSIAVMRHSGYLIADADNNRIREVLPDGTIVTVAGTGVAGSLGDGGTARNAQLDGPLGVAATRDGGFLIADEFNHAVRRVLPNGMLVTVAGVLRHQGYGGDNGPATAANLAHPAGVAETADSGFLIADYGNDRVRRVFPDGTIVTVAGNGTPGYFGDGGPATAAQLHGPLGVAVTPDGGFLIADSGNNRIRRVTPDGTIFTVAGAGTGGLYGDGGLATSALLSAPEGVAPTADGGFLIADTLNDRIRRVSPAGMITTLAGITRGFSGDGGPAIASQLDEPWAIAPTADGGALIADYANSRIRAIAGAASGGGSAPGAPVAPAAPVTPVRAPSFGARTNVSLSLTHARVRPGAELGVTVRNANAFAISGSLIGRARDRRRAIGLGTKRFAVAAHGHARVTLALSRRLRTRLARTGRLAVAVTATVTDPAAHSRRASATLTVKLAHAHSRANTSRLRLRALLPSA